MRRQAFALLEIVVCVSILALLASLLLVAINGSREAARRIDCQNRLRNVTIGLDSFYAQNRHFPEAYKITKFASGHPFAFGPSFQLLLFMEEGTFCDFLATRSPGDVRRDVDEFRPDWVQCPSDRGEKRGNLRYCVGSLPPLGIGPQDFLSNNGLFGQYRFSTRADVRNGSDTTIAVSERISFGETTSRLASMDGYTVYRAGPLGTVVTVEKLRSIRITQPDYIETHVGLAAFDVRFRDTAFNTIDTPNSKQADLLVGSGDSGASVSARSRHQGGVNVGFVSGSVRFVSDTIDHTIWNRYGAAADD